ASGAVDGRLSRAELLHVRAHPDLERLRRNGLDVLDHRTPALVALDEVPADMAYGARADREHNEVEALSHLARLCADLMLVPVGLELKALLPHAVAADELPEVGR